MPQASDELRQKIVDIFGDIDCQPPIFYLEENGYKIDGDYSWIIPEGRMPTYQEALCVRFLVEEWDFGAYSRYTEELGAHLDKLGVYDIE